ncbi:hypothetical protein ACFL1T_00710 [Chlamydiota bacterium]
MSIKYLIKKNIFTGIIVIGCCISLRLLHSEENTHVPSFGAFENLFEWIGSSFKEEDIDNCIVKVDKNHWHIYRQALLYVFLNTDSFFEDVRVYRVLDGANVIGYYFGQFRARCLLKKVGLQVGDTILKVNGFQVEDFLYDENFVENLFVEKNFIVTIERNARIITQKYTILNN